VRLSAIGDVLHALPTAVAIKDAWPEAVVGWVVEGRAGDLLEGHAAVDRVIRVPRGWLLAPAAVRSLASSLGEFDADIALDLQGLLKSGVATALSRAHARIGAARSQTREWSWLACNRRLSVSRPHIVERHLELLAGLGLTPGLPRFDMPRRPAAAATVAAWFPPPPSRTAILNPGAGWTSKLWEPARFAAVARGLRERHGVRSSVVWAGPAESEAADRIVAGSDGSAVKAPATTLHELAEACRLATLFVSSDTGPLHLAAAVGTPCVGLMGPVPASRNGPYGKGNESVEPPAAHRPAWEQRKSDTGAMAAIDVESVLAAAGRILTAAAAGVPPSAEGRPTGLSG
jgi:ADP-heptose:LPS heptosyltransferase